MAREQGARKEKKHVKAIMKTNIYEPELIRLGRVVLRAYHPVEEASALEEIEIKTSGDVLNALENRMEKAKKHIGKIRMKEYLIEISVEGKGFALHKGEYHENTTGGSGDLIFPRPSRLRALGLITSEGGVEWVRKSFRKELYVYEGEIEYPRDYIGVILETDYGRRVYRKQTGRREKWNEMA